jgi:hypothetical protein
MSVRRVESGTNGGTFAAVRAEVSPQEIVELTALTGWHVGNFRLVRNATIEPKAE